MKKLISFLFLVGLFLGVYIYQDQIVTFIIDNFINKKEFVFYENNQYAKNSSSFIYEVTDDFIVENKQDILNVFYTALNGGWKDVTFYCEKGYTTCIDDFLTLSNDTNGFNTINNIVHPFNSYEKLILNYNNFGNISISILYLYSEEEINLLNEKVDHIIEENIVDTMSLEEKIKAIHDYIINTTRYDKESSNRVLEGLSALHNAHKANGPLLEGMGICGGYTDAMALFLNRFHIENYKLSSSKHIWNYVYFNNTWRHLDLTWDDPVVVPSQDMLLHTFFLISDEELKALDETEHNYTNSSLKVVEE